MKIKIPLLMLGPYLRLFLIGCMVLTGLLAVGLFIAARFTGKDDLIKAAVNMTVSLIFFVIVFIVFWLLGMP